jgi:acyl-CoA hydrolase
MAESNPCPSVVEVNHIVMPEHANPLGSAFGGVILGWIDLVAVMSASRYCGHNVVTAKIEAVEFHLPMKVGDQICLRGKVSSVGNTSMVIDVDVFKVDVTSRQEIQATSAKVIMVALDKQGNKIKINK